MLMFLVMLVVLVCVSAFGNYGAVEVDDKETPKIRNVCILHDRDDKVYHIIMEISLL